MPRAEVGSTKYLNNKLKSKGLQRLRWYCQACERQMRDENGFKCHTQTEGHVRQMLLIGEDSRKHISDFSNQFQRDFLQLLKTSHGEKKININHFYQEYISNKEHVHMNATRWPSLTEFAKWLGRQGICRIEEGDKGLEIAWIDNSPEALRRQDAIRKKERQDKGDEEREQKLIAQQIERARQEAEEDWNGEDEKAKELLRQGDERITLKFGIKTSSDKPGPLPVMDNAQQRSGSPLAIVDPTQSKSPAVVAEVAKPCIALKIGPNDKSKNVFAAPSKKNALGGASSGFKLTPLKKMSEAERIMKEEIERKRLREVKATPRVVSKRQRIA